MTMFGLFLVAYRADKHQRVLPVQQCLMLYLGGSCLGLPRWGSFPRPCRPRRMFEVELGLTAT